MLQMLYRIKEYVMLSEYPDEGMAKIEFTKCGCPLPLRWTFVRQALCLAFKS